MLQAPTVWHHSKSCWVLARATVNWRKSNLIKYSNRKWSSETECKHQSTLPREQGRWPLILDAGGSALLNDLLDTSREEREDLLPSKTPDSSAFLAETQLVMRGPFCRSLLDHQDHTANWFLTMFSVPHRQPKAFTTVNENPISVSCS